MKQRTITGVFIVLAVALAICSTLLVKEIFDIFIAIVAVVSASEMSNILTKQNRDHNKFMGCMYIAILYVPIVFCADSSCSLIELLGWVCVAFVAWTIITFFYELTRKIKAGEDKKFKSTLNSAFNTLYLGVYPGFLLSMFFIINHVAEFSAIPNKYFALWMLVLIYVITMLSDTFAYLVGRTFKGPKVCPKISPNKTWSGCIGGLLGGVVGALAIYGILQINAFSSILTTLNINVWVFVLIGLIGSAISQVGDFYESYLKRRANVKDSGNLFPGHGGMLDRIDALMFNTMFISLFLICIL